MPATARSDGLADWYDAQLGELTKAASALLLDLLGPGQSVAGVDGSADQLRAAQRPIAAAVLILADAAALPLPDALAAGLSLDRIEEPGEEPIPMRPAFAAKP